MPGPDSHPGIAWDTWWRWEIFRRRADPLDFRRWKADSSRALRALPAGADRDGVAPRLLDSTCGMGYHALVQHELGFRVEASDASALVLEAARRLAASEGARVPIHQCRWEELGDRFPERYDLIFNDEIHQVREEAELLAALTGIRRALRPGGALVFFFADRAKPDDGPNQARWDWEHEPVDAVAWSARAQGTEVTCSRHREMPAPDLILEHLVYRVSDDGRPAREESVTVTRNYRWDWTHVTPVLRAAGFADVESHRFVNVHGNTYALNLATR